MKGLLAGLTLALVLSAAPSVASADEGVDTDVADVTNDDPGINALHMAIADMREAKVALRTECPDMHDPKCRAAFANLRAEFKMAQKAAIAKHHEFKQAQKKARDEAKRKAKSLKERSFHPSTPRG